MKPNVYKTLIKNKAIISESNLHWNVEPFVLGTRNRFNIIDLRATVKSMIIAAKVIKQTLEIGKHILIINTNSYNIPVLKEFKESLVSIEKEKYFSFVNEKWFGGTLTNWVGLSKKVTRFKRFSQFVDPLTTEKSINITALENLKKSYSEFSVLAPKEGSVRYNPSVGEATNDLTVGTKLLKANSFRRSTSFSIRSKGNHSRVLWKAKEQNAFANKLPQAMGHDPLENLNLGLVVVLNANANKHAIREAFKLNIPVVAIVDSNTFDREKIAYPIFANSFAPAFINQFFNFVSKVIRV